jgi:hypothetical protein
VWSRVSMGVLAPELLGVSVTRGGVMDLYVVFALPNPVVRDAPTSGAQPHLCTSHVFELQAWIADRRF